MPVFLAAAEFVSCRGRIRLLAQPNSFLGAAEFACSFTLRVPGSRRLPTFDFLSVYSSLPPRITGRRGRAFASAGKPHLQPAFSHEQRTRMRYPPVDRTVSAARSHTTKRTQ